MPEEPQPNKDAEQTAPLPVVVSDSAGKAFISYASQDAAIANALCDSLERAGISCWLAPRDVRPGDFYADAIIQAITACEVLILLLSRAAIDSPHVLREVERASSKRRPIITLRTDGATLPPSLEYFLSVSQWLDFSGGPVEHQFSKLIEALRSRRSAAATVQAAPGGIGGTSGTSGHQAKRNRRTFLVAVAALIAATLVYFAADKIWLSKRAANGPPASTQTNLPATPPLAAVPPSNPAPATAAFTPPPHSIAVLPFVNMSGDPRQDYFSDGVTEELLNSLSRLDELQVVARTSSFLYKGQNVDIPTIAHKLNVGAILEGSVRRAGNTIRITAQLINTVTGFHMWSETYDRQANDILKIQTEVATAVAHQLEVRLTEEDAVELQALGGTKDPKAYDAYLRGEQLRAIGDMKESDARGALAAFDQAIALDPHFALAYRGRSSALGDIAIFFARPNERPALRQRSREAAERAVALAPQLGETHLALGELLAFNLLDYGDAAPEFERALTLAPGNARVQLGFAGFSAQLGHFDRAVAAARRGVNLDPQNVWAHITLAQVLYLSRRYAEAQAALVDARVLSPGSEFISALVRAVRLQAGEVDQVRQGCESPSTPMKEGSRHECLAKSYHLLGRQADAQRELDKWKTLAGDDDAFDYAELYAQWGDKASALHWLAKSEQQRDPAFMALKVDPQLDPIRDDPEFKAILARMKFPP
jgi:TolB-like protein/Tfp pilus assembly protein PilF